MRHTSKRPRSRTNLPTVPEGAEQSQEESQRQQQQQHQQSRSLLSNIFSRRSNSQPANLAASSSSASAPQNDNGGSGTEAAQGKRKRALSSLMSRRCSSQRSGLSAQSAPQHTESDNREATPVNDGVAQTSSPTASPTTPQRPGGLSRSASSTSRLGQRIGNSFSNLSQLLPRRRRPTQDDAQPLVGEGQGADDTINDDDLRLDIDPPVHFDGFFRPGDPLSGRMVVKPRNKKGEPVIAIKIKAVGFMTRHVARIDRTRVGQPARPEVYGPKSATRGFFHGEGVVSGQGEDLETRLRGLGGVIPLSFEVPLTIAVYGDHGHDSDVCDDTEQPLTGMGDPPPSMHVQQRRSIVSRSLRSSAWERLFKSPSATVKYELRLTVTWRSPQLRCGRKESTQVEFFVQPRAPAWALPTAAPEGPPEDPPPTTERVDLRRVGSIQNIDPSFGLTSEYLHQLPWSATNFCQSGPVATRLLVTGDSPESPRCLTNFWEGQGRGSGAAAMTLTTDARPAFVTGEACPFTFGIRLPNDARLHVNGNLRMNVLRRVWTKRLGGKVEIQPPTLMASLAGGTAVQVDVPREFPQADGRRHDHFWKGHLVIEPFMLPAHDFKQGKPPRASHATRTVPSFSSRGTHVAYDLLIQVDDEIPSNREPSSDDGNIEIVRWKRSGVLCRINNIPVANSSRVQRGLSELGRCEADAEDNACIYPPRYRAPSPDAIQLAPPSPHDVCPPIVIRPVEDCGMPSEISSIRSDSTPATPLPEYPSTARPQPSWEKVGLRIRRQQEAVHRQAQASQPASATGVVSQPLHAETSAANRAVRETRAESHGPQRRRLVAWTPSQASLAQRENQESNRPNKPSPKWLPRLLRGFPITASKESVKTSSTPPRIDTPPVRVTRSPTRNQGASASASASSNENDAATEADSSRKDCSADSYGIGTVWEAHHAGADARKTSISRPAAAPRQDSSTLGETEPQQADSQSSSTAASTSALPSFNFRRSPVAPGVNELPATPDRSPAIVQQQDQDQEQRDEQPTVPVTEPSADPAEPVEKSFFSPEATPAGTPQQQDSPHAQPSQPLTAQSSVASLDAQRSSELSQLPAAPRGFTTTSRAPEQITVTQPTPERGVTAGVGTELVWSDAPQHELEPQPSASEAEPSQEAEGRVPEPAC